MKKLLFASLVVFGALTMPSCGEKKESSDTDTTVVDTVSAAPMEEAPAAVDTAAHADTSATHADTTHAAPAH